MSGVNIANSAKTTEMLLSELNKKSRELDQDLCCKLNALITAIENINVNPPEETLYNVGGSFILDPRQVGDGDFDLISLCLNGAEEGSCVHSISISVVPWNIDDTSGAGVDIIVNGNEYTYPLGTSINFEATTCLDISLIVPSVDEEECGKLVVSYILGLIV